VETASGCDGDHPEPKPHQHDQHDQNGHPVMAFAGHSLALLADAGHMLTDAGALGASLLAIRLARRPASGAWTFGFKRAEALSAQANGITLLVISAIVAFEAVSRLIRPLPVTGVMVVAVAALGVAVNVAATGVLANANRGSINVKGAFAHIVTDLYGFIGTLAAGTVIIVTFEAQMGKTIADLKVAVNAFFEYWLLATPRSLRDEIPGFEPVSTREDAEAELEEIKVMVGNLHSDKEIASRPMDAISARQYIRDIFDNFKRAMLSAGFTTSWPFRGKEELTDFLEHLPTQRVTTSLKHQYVKQTSTKWKINHLRDIEALSVAIPYTDAVVTDADVANAATRGTRLDAEFDTPVFKNLPELVSYLGL
jgi:cation diffusion facilitator family transporter